MTSSSSLYGSVTTQNSSSANSTSLYGEAGTPIPDSSGNVIVRGDLYVLSGNILTTATTGNIFPANATTINLGLAATAVNIGAATGSTTINNTLFAPGADFGNITIGVATDNTITTTTGALVLKSAINEIDTDTTDTLSTNSASFFLLNSPTTVTAFQGATALDIGAATGTTNINNDLTLDGTNLNIAQGTTFFYNENNDRLNRPNFQSTSGNSSGVRAIGANTSASSLATISAFSSSDLDNGSFINIQARNGGTDPLRIQTGQYIASVLNPSGTSLAFVDNTTTYATVNPAGPTIGIDLTTKTYVDNAVATTGVTSITGTADQVIASSSTGAVTLSLPQSIATTSNPTFAGATLGNITVGVADNQTITTTSGDLNITATAASSVNITSETTAPTLITRNSTAVASSIRSLALAVQSSGTPTVGFGNNLEWQLETAPGNTERAGYISVISTDLTAASEDFKMSFGLMQNGATYAEKAFIDSAGNMTLNGDLTVNDAVVFTGSTSGSSTFAAPATGSTLSYVLPGASGAVNTVLTNDGSGNLTWALPGGGGSTFGNVTVGIDTDQTVSTTSGNLVLQTAAGVDSGTITMASGVNGNITLAPNGTGHVILSDDSYVLGQMVATRNSAYVPPGSPLTTLAGQNGIIVASSSGGAGYGANIAIRYHSGDTTAGVQNAAAVNFSGASGTNSAPGGAASNQVLGSTAFDGYTAGTSNNYAATIATANQGAGTAGIAPLQAQGYARQAFTNSVILTTAVTGASGTGTTATLTFTLQNTAPYVVGQTVAIAGMTPNSYNNAAAVITAATTSSISYANTTTGFTSGGTIAAVNTVTAGGMGFRVRGYASSTNMTAANRFNFMDLTASTATFKSAAYTFANEVITGSTLTATNYLNLTSTGATFITGGQYLFNRTSAVAAVPAGQILRLSRTDVAGPQDSDGIDFRLSVGGTATTSNFARFDGVYKSSGLNEIGMSVSTDSFAADTDRIYIGTRESTKIRATPSGGGSTSDIITATDLSVTSARPIAYPSYTTVQRNALAPAAGWVLFNSTTVKLQCYDGANWQDLF